MSRDAEQGDNLAAHHEVSQVAAANPQIPSVSQFEKDEATAGGASLACLTDGRPRSGTKEEP
jgi:hypothetical protein